MKMQVLDTVRKKQPSISMIFPIEPANLTYCDDSSR